MRKTLLLIPHEIAGLPIFGFGWLMILMIIGVIARLAWTRKSKQPIGEVVANEGIMWALMAAVVVMVLPSVELKNVLNEPIGMAIRGYGVMLLAGVTSAVALAMWRAKRRGIDSEIVLGMAPWVFISGIVGARLFFVIQYREKFIGNTLLETLGNMVAFTEGGLVVYGGLIGGFLAAVFFIIKNRLPLLRLGDAIIPCIFIGIFFGRIGCLMNGCCYGGRCEEGFSAIHFPPGSAVYDAQINDGQLLGFSFDETTQRITEVEPGGLADQAGIQVGQRLREIVEFEPDPKAAPKDVPYEEVRRSVSMLVDTQRHTWTPAELPDRALPVQAAQVISSVSSLLLCGFLCLLSLAVRREGAIMMIGIASYAVLRFILEIVRVDESGQFGTQFSISQWVSIVVLSCSVVGLIWLFTLGNKAPRTKVA